MPEIRYIPAVGAPENAKLPVAAYCRVSSDSDDQLNSLSAQVREYTKQITADPDWELAGIYADEGITQNSYDQNGEKSSVKCGICTKLNSDSTRDLFDFSLRKPDRSECFQKLADA